MTIAGGGEFYHCPTFNQKIKVRNGAAKQRIPHWPADKVDINSILSGLEAQNLKQT